MTSFKSLRAAAFWKGEGLLVVAGKHDILYMPGILRIKYCVKQNCQLVRNFAVRKAVIFFTSCLLITLTVNKP